MTKQEQIAQFLDRYVTAWPRVHSWYDELQPWYLQPRPTAQQLAEELLQVAEFRALRLGTWLGTTDGQIITEAVGMVAPPFYRQDIELLVEALKLAASMQQSEGQDKAGKVALGAIGVAVLALAIGESGRAA